MDKRISGRDGEVGALYGMRCTSFNSSSMGRGTSSASFPEKLEGTT
jgi:hypothetical protein